MNVQTPTGEFSPQTPLVAGNATSNQAAPNHGTTGVRTDTTQTMPTMSAAPPPENDDLRDDDYDPALDYRALCASAVACFALGLLSPLALVNLTLALIPSAAIVLGLFAIRKIRRYPAEYTGLALTAIGMVLALGFGASGIFRSVNEYANELPDEQTVRIYYPELQPQPDDPPNSIPPEAKELDGKKVFIKGYVYPGMQKNGIREFLLVRDQGTCCFGGNPKLTDRIQVKLNDPKGFAFSAGLFKVAGVFHISPPTAAVDAGGAVFYHIDEAQLR
ncbi:MAG TPA: hypothetical protein VGJ15_01975 [Pirellulales bacterium]|jgi:hypothetical protein